MAGRSLGTGRVKVNRLGVPHLAKVIIKRFESDRGLLPPVCALTGEPTDHTVNKTFYWMPSWVIVFIFAGLLPYLIVALILRKSMAVRLPLSYEKRGHWFWRQTVLIVGALLGLGLIFTGIAVGASKERNESLETVGGILFVAGALTFFATLIVALILQRGTIRPVRIEGDEIHLVGVHRDFVDALEDDRDREEEDRDTRPKPAKKARRVFEDGE